MLQLYAYGTLRDIQNKKEIPVSSTKLTFNNIGFTDDRIPLCPTTTGFGCNNLAARQLDSISVSHSLSLPLSFSTHGAALTTHDPQSQRASLSASREPSASADIFQSPFQQMEFYR